MVWAGVLDGFGGITWLGRDLARGTGQARAAGRGTACTVRALEAHGAPGVRDPQLGLQQRQGKLPVPPGLLPVPPGLRCLTTIRCAAFVPCFPHPSPVSSFPELFPAGMAGPGAPLHHSTTGGFHRARRMWWQPGFSWIEGRTRDLGMPREAAVPGGAKSCLELL